jgi:hypothetical protein
MKVPVTSNKPGAGYDAAVTAINTNLVHRWKFQESSGDFADSVGSLTLAATGTFIYGVPGPIDSAVAFQASAKGLSTGLGSIPTGSGQRTVVVVYKPTKGTNPKQALCSYGTTGSTRQYFVMSINDAVVDTETFAVWSDDITVAAAGGSGTCWHVFVARVDSGGTSGKMFNLRRGAQYRDGRRVYGWAGDDRRHKSIPRLHRRHRHLEPRLNGC